ncbi:GNAT family N-acetyltransferase [Mesorhizobium sp. AA22]|uniref:GNAT family N-acetyltransferase n=1 Tax=Mesorhizobium sp. AA22 TaxID=1854057 RepID=UPI000A7E4787|nr:GNAT family N-acetyltransferase [Mesorhizobium sp. AA22]
MAQDVLANHGCRDATRISDEDHTLQRIAAKLTDTKKMSFVAERPEGSIAGYAMAKMNEAGDVMLDRLHIDQSEYGTGLAANILHAVFAAHSGIPSIALEVLEGNDRAMAFLSQTWFEVVDRRAASHLQAHAKLSRLDSQSQSPLRGR